MIYSMSHRDSQTVLCITGKLKYDILKSYFFALVSIVVIGTIYIHYLLTTGPIELFLPVEELKSCSKLETVYLNGNSSTYNTTSNYLVRGLALAVVVGGVCPIIFPGVIFLSIFTQKYFFYFYFYFFYFLLISIILLFAMIGSIVLCVQEKINKK